MMAFRTCLHVSSSFAEVEAAPSSLTERFASLSVRMGLDLLPRKLLRSCSFQVVVFCLSSDFVALLKAASVVVLRVLGVQFLASDFRFWALEKTNRPEAEAMAYSSPW